MDLNADLGEGAGGGNVDESMLEFVTSASIACGFHAGEPVVMEQTLRSAAVKGVVVGAHPSYRDREGFGRVARDVEPNQLIDELLYQIGALDGVARRCDTRVRYVKPHGALYNQMAVDERTAKAVCEAVRAYAGVSLLAPARSVAIRVAQTLGVEVASEVFADRAYSSEGALVPREKRGAVITDPREAARRVVLLATEKRVRTIDGATIELEGSSICVHGDTPNALAIAAAVRSALEDAGIPLRSFVQ